MVLTRIDLSRPGLTPPVFVAGSFTQWQLVEMTPKVEEGQNDSQHGFTTLVDLAPGEHQYKFRLGGGDWWIVDESAPTAKDGMGNVNNIVRVQHDSDDSRDKRQPNGKPKTEFQPERSLGSSVSSHPVSPSASAPNATTPASQSVSSDHAILDASTQEGEHPAIAEPAEDLNGSTASSRMNPAKGNKEHQSVQQSRPSLLQSLWKLCTSSTRQTAFGFAALAVALAIYLQRR